MPKSVRFRYLLLALMVTASHVALVSHAAAHFQPSLEQCELCVSQAHPLAAIPTAEPPPAADGGIGAGLQPVVALSRIANVEYPHQPRGPPGPFI